MTIIIKFNKPEDGNFWLTNFYKREPINSLLPTKIDNNGKIAEDSDYFIIDIDEREKGRKGDEPFRFASAEHLFQALKFAWQDPNWVYVKQRIKQRKRVKVFLKPGHSGENARYFAETDPTKIGGEIRRDWDTYKLNAMKYVIRQKFTQNPELKQRLMDTGYEMLIVDNNLLLDETEDDKFWGVTHYIDERNHVGQNHLGKILMEIREELQKKEGWTEREESGDSSGSSERPTTFFIDEESAHEYSRDLLRKGLIYSTQRNRLTQINSTSNWLIFHASSLEREGRTNENSELYRSDSYKIKSKALKEIFKCLAEEAGHNNFDFENFKLNFNGDTAYNPDVDSEREREYTKWSYEDLKDWYLTKGRKLKKKLVGNNLSIYLRGVKFDLHESREGHWQAPLAGGPHGPLTIAIRKDREGKLRYAIDETDAHGNVIHRTGDEIKDTRSTKLWRWLWTEENEERDCWIAINKSHFIAQCDESGVLSTIFGGELNQLEDGSIIDSSLRNRKKTKNLDELLDSVITAERESNLEKFVNENKEKIIINIARKKKEKEKEKENITFVIKNAEIDKSSATSWGKKSMLDRNCGEMGGCHKGNTDSWVVACSLCSLGVKGEDWKELTTSVSDCKEEIKKQNAEKRARGEKELVENVDWRIKANGNLEYFDPSDRTRGRWKWVEYGKYEKFTIGNTINLELDYPITIQGNKIERIEISRFVLEKELLLDKRNRNITIEDVEISKGEAEFRIEGDKYGDTRKEWVKKNTLIIGLSCGNIRKATKEEVRNSKGDEYKKGEIIEKITNTINAINNIESIEERFKITDETRGFEGWERRITDAPNFDEAERIKNEIHEAILTHIRDVLRNLRADSYVETGDLEPENRFYRAEDPEGRSRNDALSITKNPELENVAATTQRIVTDILAKKLDEEAAEFINKFKDAQGGREAMETITNQEILAYKEKGWDAETARRIWDFEWEARDLKEKEASDANPIAILEGTNIDIFRERGVGKKKSALYMEVIASLPDENEMKIRFRGLNFDQKRELIKSWMRKHFTPKQFLTAAENDWVANDVKVKDRLDKNREIAGKASLNGEEGSYIFDPLIVKKERVVAQDEEWRELFPDAAERYKWQSSLILTPRQANYLGREKKWEPNDIRPLFNRIYIYIMSDGREVRPGDPDYEVVNRTRRLGDKTVRETIMTDEQQLAGVEIFLPYSSTILFNNKKEWRKERETMPKKSNFYARLFKNCLEGELREIADRTEKLPVGKRWDTDPLFTGMTEDLFRDRDPTDEEIRVAEEQGKRNLRAEIHAWRKKGFNFDDARIAFERGWNARTDNISDKNYNDPDNTGLFTMFDGTTFNPITTNKTREHTLTEFGLAVYFSEQKRIAQTMLHTNDLEALRRQIAFLNSFAIAEAGSPRNIVWTVPARTREENEGLLRDLREREIYIVETEESRRWEEVFANRYEATQWRTTGLEINEAQTAQRNGWLPNQITERMAHLDGTDDGTGYNPLEITAETAERWHTTFLDPGTRNQWIATGLTFEQCQTAKNNGWIIDFIVRPIDLANPLAELRMTARPGETPLTFPITIRLRDTVNEAYERLFFANRGIADNEIKNRWIDLDLNIYEAIRAYDEKHWDNLEGVGRNEDNRIIYESHEQTTMIDLRGLWTYNKNDLDTVHSLLNDIKRETDSSNLMYQIRRTVGQRIANFDIADDALPESARKANIEHARNIKSLTLNGWGETLRGTINFDDGSHLQAARDRDNIYLVNYTSSHGITINNIDIRLHGKTQIDNAHRILTDIRGKTIDSIDDLNDRGVIHTQIEAISAADNEKLPNELKKTALNRKRTERRNEINNEYAEWNRFFADHVAEFGRDAPTHEQNALRQSWRNSNLSPTRHAGADSEADQVWNNGWRDFNDNGTLGDVDNKGGRVSGFNRLTGTFVYTSYGIPTNGVDPRVKNKDDLDFIHYFQTKGAVMRDEEILAYKKTSPNRAHRLTEINAWNSYDNGWTNPEEISINNEGRGIVCFADDKTNITNWEVYSYWRENKTRIAKYQDTFRQAGNGILAVDETERELPVDEAEINNWIEIYSDPAKSRRVYDKYWNPENIGNLTSGHHGEITWNSVDYDNTINPEIIDKLAAYETALNNAPGSTRPGRIHVPIGRDEINDIAFDWLSKNYPPTDARINIDNGWSASDVADYNIQPNQGRVIDGEPYSYNTLNLLKSQAQFIHEFRGTIPVGLTNDQILTYQGKGFNGTESRAVYNNGWHDSNQLGNEGTAHARQATLDGTNYNIDPLTRTKQQAEGIQAVNHHWDNNVANLAAGTDKNAILGRDWESKFDGKNGPECTVLRAGLTTLIDNEITNQRNARTGGRGGAPGGGGGGYTPPLNTGFGTGNTGGGNTGNQNQTQPTPTTQTSTNQPTSSGTSSNNGTSAGNSPDGSPSPSSSSSSGYFGGGFTGGGGGGGNFSPTSTSESKDPPVSKSQPTPTKPESNQPTKNSPSQPETPLNPEIITKVKTQNSEGENWTPEEKAIIEKILTENVAKPQDQPEKDQKAAKITTVEKAKLVQELMTKTSQALKTQTYSQELHNWLVEQKETNAQIYQMVNAYQQQVQKAIKRLEQLQKQQQQVNQTSFTSPKEKKWLPWAISGGVLATTAVLGATAWYLNKIPTGTGKTKPPLPKGSKSKRGK
ncbi:NADAR family protein [endosymbiont GvMRE of Glomus versiforme]|uniref:NADAR family protein n=1 Tax=endosymbiont GvMRE of Glomus versiforme TaxID=2039283 RepID=UPI000ED5E5F3|nr:NADAR family protein [endosymbiont GvMRE of Glomus versiforme]RHZ37300.1 YbiA-like swarming motility protein [endosymbiont GvMRE of Glomus versiforme]